jgi:hypothetical protein
MTSKAITKHIAWRILLLILYLVVLDVAISAVFRYPSNPLEKKPSEFQQYFEYGRSVEGKYSRMTQKMRDWGWVGASSRAPLADTKDQVHQSVVALYGMSHTGDLATAIAEADKGYAVRALIAPGATPNWAYAAYQKDESPQRADAVVLGIMTLGVPFITTTSGAMMSFDAGYPYTYPRYLLKDGKLEARWPPFSDLEGFLAYFNDAGKWSEYRKWLSVNDGYYDPLLFRSNLLDESSLGRLFRRAYALRSRGNRTARVYDSQGFREGTEEIAVLRAIVQAFAENARMKGSIPVIYIVNNQGCGDQLLQVLRPVLDADRIPYLSTDKICPPGDPSAFLPGSDGHFTAEKNLELANALIAIIDREREKKRAS